MERGDAIVRALHWLVRLAAGGLFVYAGVLKAIDPARFADDIEAYRLLPYRAGAALAVYLPWLEIACGAGLILGWLRRGAATLLIVLTSIFILAAATAWARGIDLTCGCFGRQSGTAHAGWLVARNALILAGLVFVAFYGLADSFTTPARRSSEDR